MTSAGWTRNAKQDRQISAIHLHLRRCCCCCCCFSPRSGANPGAESPSDSRRSTCKTRGGEWGSWHSVLPDCLLFLSGDASYQVYFLGLISLAVFKWVTCSVLSIQRSHVAFVWLVGFFCFCLYVCLFLLLCLCGCFYNRHLMCARSVQSYPQKGLQTFIPTKHQIKWAHFAL